MTILKIILPALAALLLAATAIGLWVRRADAGDGTPSGLLGAHAGGAWQHVGRAGLCALLPCHHHSGETLKAPETVRVTASRLIKEKEKG